MSTRQPAIVPADERAHLPSLGGAIGRVTTARITHRRFVETTDALALGAEVDRLRARVAELEAAAPAGPATGTDYGVHWPEVDPRAEDVEHDDRARDGGEEYARRVVSRYRGQGVPPVLVSRSRGPWRPVDVDVEAGQQ